MLRPSPSSKPRAVCFWLVVTVIGLALRVAMVPLGPRYGYMADHDDFVRWGIQATDHGLLTLYDRPPPRRDLRTWTNGQWTIAQRDFDRVCNYPPLSAYLLYGSGLLFKGVSSDRLINTTVSRAVFESWSILADFFLAWGCASLVARLRSGRAGRWTYLLVLLAPPLWWDSAAWGQMDSPILATLVWMVRAMIDSRWWMAGALFGLAAGLKPQAVLLLPLWALAVVGTRPRIKPLLALVLAGAVLLLMALPFTVHSGLAWWHNSYVANLTTAYGEATTLMACNIWYVDLLLTGSADATRCWLGVTKDIWGKVFLLAGLAGGFALAAWRWRCRPESYVLLCALTLLVCVMLPTRVHERYLLLALPWLVMAAVMWRRFWAPALMLTAVATFQVTWPLWLHATPDWEGIERQAAAQYDAILATATPEQKARALPLAKAIAPLRQQYLTARGKTVCYEWVFTLLALTGTALTVTAAAVSPTGRSPPT